MQDYIKCKNVSHRNEPFEFLGYKIVFTCITYAIVYLLFLIKVRGYLCEKFFLEFGA